MSNTEANSRITASLITALAMIIVAIVGFFGIKVQTETPIFATLTAQPPIIAVTNVAITVDAPKFTVYNRLYLPISIYIDKKYIGEVTGQSSKIFILNSYPVKVDWSIVKVTLSNGAQLGNEMGESFENITNGSYIVVDNVVGNQLYFFPIISNNTQKNCFVTINESWEDSFVTNATVTAYASNVSIGYFRLYSNSNVFLNCDGQSYWWGLRSGINQGVSFSQNVEVETGVIRFTLNP